ncbi:MAG: biotin synthase BioB [Actinobacteria bacterium]|nr:biotin synthase BioB [Actinomycetota bacterium]
MSSKQCTLIERCLSNTPITQSDAEQVLNDPKLSILALCDAAFQLRHQVWGRDVQIHTINNVKNGFCPEDCNYCAQSKLSDAPIENYPSKANDEIVAEAKRAYESGSFRYCMVLSGRAPSKTRLNALCASIKAIKDAYPMELCLSAGLVDRDGAKQLKDAGLDRLNHNLNTSESYYNQICSTHSYQDRLDTLLSAQSAGLELCSGLIVGMGESQSDVIEVLAKLRDLKVPSIPINFYTPIGGTPLNTKRGNIKMSPEFCLRVLCLARFMNPTAEIRIAAGREYHLGHMQALALFPANSLFLDGYLNTPGTQLKETMSIIKDAGFDIKSDQSIDDMIAKLGDSDEVAPSKLKSESNLRPTLA